MHIDLLQQKVASHEFFNLQRGQMPFLDTMQMLKIGLHDNFSRNKI